MCRILYIWKPPPVLLSSAAPVRWSILTSTGRTPIITHDMVYVMASKRFFIFFFIFLQQSVFLPLFRWLQKCILKGKSNFHAKT